MAHTAIGPHDPFIQRTINALAMAGYLAFALDMYGAPDIVLGALSPQYIPDELAPRLLSTECHDISQRHDSCTQD